MSVSALSPFRLLLDHLDESDRSDILNYFRIVHAIGEEVVDEVATRLLKPTASRGSRLLAVETAFYHPWASWVEHLPRTLRHESDEEVFDVGVRALGRIGTQDAYEALRDLYAIRQETAFQEILSWEMVRTDPKEAFQTYLARLMEGSGNPRVANDAANELLKLVAPDNLPSLFLLAWHEDLLITRHALRLITSILAPQAAEWLCMHLEDNHAMALGDRTLKEWLSRFRLPPGPELRDALMQELEAGFGAKHPDTYAELVTSMVQDAQAQAQAMGTVRTMAEGLLEDFLVQMLALSMEGKPAKVSAFLSESAEGMHLRARRTAHAIDTCALGLVRMVSEGCAEKARVLPLLKEAYAAQTGREGVGRALGLLLEPEDQDTQDLILSNTDSPSRGAALDAVGSQVQDAMLPFMLRACRDPIEDVAQRVILALGRLAGAREAALQLLAASNLDDIYLGINILALNRMADAVPALMDYMANCTREEISLKVVQALGQIGAREASPVVLKLLHSGQSPRMQVALATCLRDMGDEASALGLSERAMELRQPQILLLAVEAMVMAGGSEANPLDEARELILRHLAQGLWEDRDPWPWRFRVIEALDGLWCARPELYDELLQMMSSTLADKRAASMWSAEQQTAANNVFRNLSRRAKEARGLQPG